ncbi:hypothetical protein [Pseudoduganella sp. HUAS MS19]
MKNQLDAHMADFEKLCLKIQLAEDQYSKNTEALYGELLDFLKRKGTDQKLYAGVLIDAVRHVRNARREGRGILSIDAIAFCMHELRWSEVLEVAISEHREYFVPRKDAALVRLIDAFDDNWSEASDYSRFSAGGDCRNP